MAKELKPLNHEDVRFLVVHCSATRCDRNFPVESLIKTGIERFGQPSYHWYVRRNGNLFPTLSESVRGAHNPEVIRMLLTITTPDHLLYGSDYPYVAPQVLTQSLQRMEQYLTTEPDLAPYKEMILHKNAKRLLERR